MKYHTTDSTVIVRLDLDDSVKESLRIVASQENITAASITGIGALKDFTLGYFRPNEGEYKKSSFSRSHELTNATGVVSRKEGAVHIHMHVTLAGPDHAAIGGHLHKGSVAAAGEFFLQPISARVERQHSDHLNLDLMTFKDE